MTSEKVTAKTKVPADATIVEIPGIELSNFPITLIGDSPLIMHRWSEKAKGLILAKQTKQARQAKEAKVPEQDFKDAIYFRPDGSYGFPAVAFKASAVAACRYVDGLKMTEVRGAFHINEELVHIDSADPIMREDMVRVGMGTADIRYRPEFEKWATTFEVTFNRRAISIEQIVNLFNIAGFGVGIGEWRPERNGSYGRFHVEAM